MLKKLEEIKELEISPDGMLRYCSEHCNGLEIFTLLKILTSNNHRPLKVPEKTLNAYKALVSKLGLQHYISNRHITCPSDFDMDSWFFIENCTRDEHDDY